MALKYYKLRWPDPAVPAGEPTWMLYEVEQQTDNVLRLVELFEGGSSERSSLALKNQNRPSVESLVSMRFTESIADHAYEIISAEMFNELYAAATDRAD
ncbi:MAG: hypothetical protein NXH70_10140 [Hyphomonas sp.]|jgi:hypothetical protein|nr:hypothetical protein [Hyphomonas sp.]